MDVSTSQNYHDKSHSFNQELQVGVEGTSELSCDAKYNQKGLETKYQVALTNDPILSHEHINLLTPLGLNWSKKLMELVGRKVKLMESFSLLSTIGGGFSALGENNHKFSMRAGTLSLGQQLRLAELLGDERLKVMCHLFAALAALQLENRQFCINYIRRVIVPMISALPHCDPVINNILSHIVFRLKTLNNRGAIKNKEN